MNLTLSQCFVLVHDPDLALAFYRDTLGLELRNDVAKGDFRWLTVGVADAEVVQEPTDQPWGTRDLAVRDPSGNLVRIDQPPAG